MTATKKVKDTELLTKVRKTTKTPIRKKEAKVNTRTKKSPNKTPFPFLKLPGEIRNSIYEYALVDPKYAIAIDGPGERLLLKRGDKHANGYSTTDAKNYTKGRPLKWALNYRLCPQFLRVCRQIHIEAAPMLYAGNHFLFLDTFAMNNFLARYQGMIHHIRRVSLFYIGSRNSISTTRSAFAKLIDAINLEALVLEIGFLRSLPRRSWYQNAFIAAENFYHVAHPWLWAIAGRKGGKSTALDLIFFPGTYPDETQETPSFARYPARSGLSWIPGWINDPDSERQFRTRLKRLMK
ncbi:hypothetical protein K469DRAFT_747577 [Zopfia rhizophila CBS 207.26]|uniref:DUF7730 domain-containing protein n=1 Tax=Zopfia rhizophila CBS 207.26 TaxID=1314779 RepID=A0A6A6EG22_9PEZI|nr:hypothetical protein K469DRAFT_747577 [Zopfia rhizophila CBS 207.26]